ncbi:MFS transporter [Neobacillus muris]|uniref:MFS transporter n=1 Tax=Neobacillus muris TaxID=2941334 RepID=UPI0020410BEA|nr:MFS transporter [Neobacillus muris]
MEQQIGKPKERIWTKDFILIVCANFFIFLGFQMTLPTIPLYVEELGGNNQLIGVVVGIFTFSALLLRPFAGNWLETKGRGIVYLSGLVIFVISVGSFGFLAGISLLFMMRVVQGIGWGFSTTASGTIATDLIPPSRRGEGLGYYGVSGNIAMAIGPALGLTLTGFLPFKQLFLICAGLGLMAFILSSRIKYKKVVPGTVKTKLAIYEKSALKPSLLLFFLTVTFGGIATFLPLYTAEKQIAGIQLYFLLYALATLATRMFAGQLYDRKGHTAVFAPGSLLILIAMLLLAWLPNNMVLYTAAVLYGLGFGSVQPALQAWAIEKAPMTRRGLANATFFSFFDLGVGIGAMMFGQIGQFFGYSSIYKTSAISVLISILLYAFFVYKERKGRVGVVEQG